MHRLHDLTDLSQGRADPGGDLLAAELAKLLKPLAADLTAFPHEVHVLHAGGALALVWRLGDVAYTAEFYGDHRMFLMTDNVIMDEVNSRDVPFDVEVLRGLLRTGKL